MSKRNRNGASILFKYELMYVTKAGDAFCVEVEDFFFSRKKGRRGYELKVWRLERVSQLLLFQHRLSQI